MKPPRILTRYQWQDRINRDKRARFWTPIILAIALGLIAGLALCWKAGWM